MNNVEIGPCSPEEYRRGEEERLMEDELRPRSLYTWMALFDGLARKNPSDINEIDLYDEESNIYIVRFTILDAHLCPHITSDSLFQDGIYQRQEKDDTSLVIGKEDGPVSKLVTGYFREPKPSSDPEAEDYVENGLKELLDHASGQKLIIR